MRKHLLATMLLGLLAASPAQAQLVGTDTVPGSSCAGFPDGATRMTADADLDGQEVILVCDGTNWQAMAEGDPCATPATTPLGAVCADGALFAGRYNGNYYYVSAGYNAPAQWKTTATTTAGTTSTSNGLANTNAMAAAGIANHPAAQACRNIGAAWYLPAQDELSLYLRYKMTSLGSYSSGPNVLSSTEQNATQTSFVSMTSGAINTFHSKTTALTFLCVRN